VRRWFVIAIVVVVLIVTLSIAMSWLIGRGLSPTSFLTKSAGSPNPAPPATLSSGVASCHEHDGLPDQSCTPGATSADVVQTTIQATICTTGYTSHGVRSDGRPVRPPSDFTERLKASGIRAYGYSDTSLSDYEEDHLIPLELGGDGWSPSNLWPEPRYGQHTAAQKDGVENHLHDLVCSGRTSLAVAQLAIVTNWETAVSVV
jgi:hypothetical protein